MIIQPWWAVVGAVPVVVAKGIMNARSRRSKEDSTDETFDPERSNFVCERVCTSDKLLRRLGSLSKDPTRNTCVTVCGTSAVDACRDACLRTACVNLHQVPAWNDACVERCTAECLKISQNR